MTKLKAASDTAYRVTEWRVGTCSQCYRPFRYPVNTHYTPKTCTEFECAFKEAHPELKR